VSHHRSDTPGSSLKNVDTRVYMDVADLIAKSRHCVVFTGAGMSAESGVPTFRGRGGLWERYRPEELATPEAFARDPVLVWKWYKWKHFVTRVEQNFNVLAKAYYIVIYIRFVKSILDTYRNSENFVKRSVQSLNGF